MIQQGESSDWRLELDGAGVAHQESPAGGWDPVESARQRGPGRSTTIAMRGRWRGQGHGDGAARSRALQNALADRLRLDLGRRHQAVDGVEADQVIHAGEAVGLASQYH